MGERSEPIVRGFCGQAPEPHGDSDAGPMTVCPTRAGLIGCVTCGAVWYSDRDPLCECDEGDEQWETP